MKKIKFNASNINSALKNSVIKFNKNKLITVIAIIVTFIIKKLLPSGCDATGAMCYNRFHFFETITNYVLFILIGYLILEIIKDIITPMQNIKKDNEL